MAEQRNAGGVIHDLGYRAYDGSRASDATIGWSLFTMGFRHVWGLGRVGRAKVLPFTLLALSLLPAVVMVGTLALTSTDFLISRPLRYLGSTQLLTSVFVAAQAPVLFSRDLRSRSIVLYLARPLSVTGFVLARWGALVAAVATFLLAPLVVLTVGSFAGDGDGVGYLTDTLKALPLVLLLTLLLSGIAAVISSYALRRGVAVVVTIVSLVVVTLLVASVQGVADFNDLDQLGALAGLASPWSLVGGLGDAFGLGSRTTPPTGVLVPISIVFGLLVSAGAVWLLIRRFAKAGR